MRIFLIVLCLLATLPMIFGGFMSLSAGAMMYSVTKNIQADMEQGKRSREPYSDELDVVGHLNAYNGALPSYLGLLDPENMDSKLREIGVTQVLPLNSFLERGESRPADDYVKIMLSSRAAKMAEKECRLLKQSIAEKCAVRSASAKFDKRSKKVTLTARYLFTQKGGVGQFDAKQPLRFVSAREEFKRKGGSGESARIGIYRKIAQKCATLRRKEGNCAITKFGVFAGRDGRGLKVKLRLSALQRRR